ncbi:MAG: ECF-type sigma factor [Xanthomonadales bacterium]|nr:ECF-type sigma factor [Xanthomonadales bacterium]
MNEDRINDLLDRAGEDPEAREALYQLVYADLRGLAGHRLAVSRPGETLSVTALVNEAYLKLTERTGRQWADKTHFLRVAARAMRQITIDYMRARLAEKRGGGQTPVSITQVPLAADLKPAMVLALEEGLQILGREQPRLVEVVECRFFAGMSVAETAQALGLSTRTVERDWLAARGWLVEFLE